MVLTTDFHHIKEHKLDLRNSTITQNWPWMQCDSFCWGVTLYIIICIWYDCFNRLIDWLIDLQDGIIAHGMDISAPPRLSGVSPRLPLVWLIRALSGPLSVDDRPLPFRTSLSSRCSLLSSSCCRCCLTALKRPHSRQTDRRREKERNTDRQTEGERYTDTKKDR